MKVILNNVERDYCREIELPIKEDELLDITSEVLGRDSDGYLIENQWYTVTDQDGKTCESVFDLKSSLNRGRRYASQYAAKYICDRTNRDVSKITDEDLAKCFSGCVIPAKEWWYPFIREEIEKMIVEADGKPIGAERE